MLRDLQKESPNMNYQVSKVKIAIAKTWDAKYDDWENKPNEKYKDDWITSNITRFICLIRVCAKGLAEKADKRKDWVSEIFGEGVVGESQEEGVEPLGNPCGISAAVGCEGCGFILTIFNDPDHCGYCNVCLCKELEKRDSEVDNPTFGVAPSAAETDVRPTTPQEQNLNSFMATPRKNDRHSKRAWLKAKAWTQSTQRSSKAMMKSLCKPNSQGAKQLQLQTSHWLSSRTLKNWIRLRTQSFMAASMANI